MPRQQELIACPPPPAGTVYVNDRVSFRTEGHWRVISVHGVVFAHYNVEDRAAEAYAMVTLSASGYATQTEIAEAFGYTTRTLRRYADRVDAGGVRALVRGPGRPPGRRPGTRKERGRDRTILQLKAKGASNRAIAGKLGVSEKAIRKRLRQLGWQPAPNTIVLLFPETASDETAVHAAVEANTLDSPPDGPAVAQPPRESRSRVDEAPASGDTDPLDRSVDRLLAALGLIDDAVPVFAPAQNLPRAGVLLASRLLSPAMS